MNNCSFRLHPSSLLFLPRVETIAYPGFCQDVARRGRVKLNLLAQLAYEHAQVCRLGYSFDAPDRCEQRSMRENFAGMTNHVNQQGKLFRRQVYFMAAHHYVAAFEVKSEIA